VQLVEFELQGSHLQQAIMPQQQHNIQQALEGLLEVTGAACANPTSARKASFS
jgi:hypothetical protein